jgi:hypothetical protein
MKCMTNVKKQLLNRALMMKHYYLFSTLQPRIQVFQIWKMNNLPGPQSFHNIILPAVYKKLRVAIHNKVFVF